MVPQSYEWDFLRRWCLDYIDVFLWHGRRAAGAKAQELKWSQLKRSGPAAEVVLDLSDVVNEEVGPPCGDEEISLLQECRILLSVTDNSPEDVHERFIALLS